jgi:hypothetical protein
VRAAEARLREQRSSACGAASSEGEAMQRHETVGAETARRGSDARRRTDGSARFRRRVRVQDNRPRGVRAGWEQRAGDATRRGGPAGGYAGVPAVFQQHTCVSRGSSAREQEDLEVRGGVGIANQSGLRRSWHSEPIRLYRLDPGVAEPT